MRAAPASVPQDPGDRLRKAEMQMSDDGGREPPEKTAAGSTHSGLNYYNPEEQKQILGAFNVNR